ncbi:uncharacterized protein LOC143592101 [Bidens hawaiensis]|uniref:uncharacterized protein LOC143592101 n=1 Tax=Bidens hawaiensis TaxID=980011 RepID=UPI004049CC99
MDRFIKSDQVYMKIEAQLDEFKYKRGLFGHRASLNSYMDHVPITWWDNYGDEVPKLKAFAMKILCLTCSASSCERNWSTFSQVHTKRRNRLSTIRMTKLVYIIYNKKLKNKHIKRASLKDGQDPIVVEEVLSDDEWIADPSFVGDAITGVGGSSGEGESSSARTRKRRRVETVLVDEDEDEDDDDDPTWDGENDDESIEEDAEGNEF